MHHSIKFIPGYDKRGGTPNYGQHSMEIQFIVRDEKYGALIWAIVPGWLPAPDQRQPFQYANFNTHGYITDPHVDESTCHDNCEYLDGEPCTAQFYSGYESQEALFSGFILNGEDWLWEKLEAFHAYFFANGDKPL